MSSVPVGTSPSSHPYPTCNKHTVFYVRIILAIAARHSIQAGGLLSYTTVPLSLTPQYLLTTTAAAPNNPQSQLGGLGCREQLKFNHKAAAAAGGGGAAGATAGTGRRRK